MDAANGAQGRRPARDGRLEAVASLVPRGSRVADVGTGHGLLPHRLLGSGHCPHCIATERTAVLLREVRSYPRGHRLAGSLELRSGDGLEALRPEDGVEVVVIAGLGGPSILGILDRSPIPCASFTRFVLQPQTEPGNLRKGLIERRLAIVDERLVHERGRFYVALAAEPRSDPAPAAWPGLTLSEVLEVGPCLLHERHPLLEPYWRRQADRLERILERAGQGPGRQAASIRLDLARRVLRAVASVG